MKTEYKTKYTKLGDYESGRQRYVHEVYEIFTNDNNTVYRIIFFISTPELFHAQFEDIKAKQTEIVNKHINGEDLKSQDYYYKFLNSDYLITNFKTL